MWWPWGKKKVAEPAPDHTLSDIIRGLAHAAAAADEVQDRHFIKNIERYFERTDSGEYVPKYCRVMLPGQAHYMDVPLLCLMDPGTLHLSELDVKVAVRMAKSEVKQTVDAAGRDLNMTRAAFTVEFTGSKPGSRQDVMEVTMKFKRPEEKLEALGRLIDDLNQSLLPKPIGDGYRPPKRFTDVYTAALTKKHTNDE